MKYWTYSEIRTKVRADLGIEQETFVTPDELLGYVNEAIDMIESEIHTLYEDYFLTRKSYTITTGLVEYSLPENIYAMKIRSIIFRDGTDVYTIKRYKNRIDMFEQLEYQNFVEDDVYQYIIFNDADAAGPMIQLVPSPKVTADSAMKVYYIRNAARMENDASICDIPEFTNVVVQYAKMMCYEKESDPRYDLASQKFERMWGQMIGTLTNMTPDGDNMVEKDMQHYYEMGVEEMP